MKFSITNGQKNPEKNYKTECSGMNAAVLEILAKSEVVSNISRVTQNFSVDLSM